MFFGNIPKLSFSKKKQASATARGYSADYERLRAIVLAEQPICCFCGAAFSTQCHHLDKNPHNNCRANLCGTCAPCHRKLHAKHS